MNQTTPKFEMLLSPRRLFFRVLVAVFLAELVVHFFIFRVEKLVLNGFPQELLDSATLSLMLAPFLWWWLIRPLGIAAMHEKMLAAKVINTSVDSIITIDDRGRITAFNRAAERLFGYAKQEVLGQNVNLLMPPPEREQHDAHLGRYLRTGEKKVIGLGRELVAQRKDGATFPIYLSLSEAREGDRPIFTGIVRDLTDRKQIEKEQARLTAILKATTDMVATADLKGFVQYINHAGRKMLGLGEDQDVTSTRIVDYHAEWAASIVTNVGIPAAIENGFWSGETALLSRDGREIPLSQVIIAHTAPDGTIEYLSTIGRDITERSRAQDEIRKLNKELEKQIIEVRRAEERYHSIFENAVEGIFQTTADGRFIAANPAMARLLGYDSPGDLMASVTDAQRDVYVDPDSRAEFERRLQRSDRVSGLELKYRRKDGSLVVVSESARAVRDESGTLLYYEGIAEDITERKRAEAKILSEQLFSESIVNSLPGIFYLFDQTGKFLRWNKNFEQITGYSPEEIGTLSPLDLFVGQEKELIAQRIQEAFAIGASDAEAHLISKSGQCTPYYFTGARIDSNGQPCLIGLGLDIAERKLLEDQLRQAQKMEAIGQLAGGVAHDFNNLLTAINGYSGLALQKIDDDHPLRGYLEEIKKAGDRATNLTRQLLAFGRKQILQPLPINLNDVVTDINKMLRRLIGEDIVLTAKLEPTVPKIKADPGQVEQVLVNLVVNARDAMPHGGKLTIETSEVDLDREYADRHVGVVPGSYVMLAVSDTGTGMDEDTRARIFDPFFTTKEQGKGTGLGLSTVYGIVKQSGGNIWVYSELGHGTTFKVYLPVLAVDSQQTEAAAVELPMPSGSETILLVEDEDVVRGLARKILEHAGYHVLEASRGEEAVRLCLERAGPIDLLLTDVVMPETSGKEVANRLTELLPGLRVLFMSGYTDAAIVHHGVLDSDVEFIQKPFSPAALCRRVREVLDSKRENSGK
jgi:PAS domain S-box-containing protein